MWDCPTKKSNMPVISAKAQFILYAGGNILHNIHFFLYLEGLNHCEAYQATLVAAVYLT